MVQLQWLFHSTFFTFFFTYTVHVQYIHVVIQRWREAFFIFVSAYLWALADILMALAINVTSFM